MWFIMDFAFGEFVMRDAEKMMLSIVARPAGEPTDVERAEVELCLRYSVEAPKGVSMLEWLNSAAVTDKILGLIWIYVLQAEEEETLAQFAKRLEEVVASPLSGGREPQIFGTVAILSEIYSQSRKGDFRFVDWAYDLMQRGRLGEDLTEKEEQALVYLQFLQTRKWGESLSDWGKRRKKQSLNG